MTSFPESLIEYRKQLKKGTIRVAYKGLMRYFDDLRLHLEKKYPDYFLSDVRYGQMDYTYLYFFPKSLKRQGLKITVLFIHDTFQFEAWLSGYNKDTQVKHWKLFKENGWSKSVIAPTGKGTDYITTVVLVENPDFSNMDSLTNQIETKILKFTADVEEFLSKNRK